jgi:alkaline phosphatase D
MRTAVVLAAILVVAALFAAPANAVRFKYGVAAGDVSSSSAVLWGHATGRATVELQLSRSRRFRRGRVTTIFVRARKSDDYTLHSRVLRLTAGRRYWFRFVSGRRRSSRGTFITAPRRSSSRVIRFGLTGDTDFSPTLGQSTPYWNTGGVFRRLKAERNDFNVHLGDTIYSDSEVPGRLRPVALSVRQKWGKYKLNLGNRFLRALRGSATLYSQWDDHEFMNDFSPRESSFRDEGLVVNIDGGVLYRRGVKAFRDYAPVRVTSNGLYRTFRWGKNLELFFLDERSFRSAKASAGASPGGVCQNPQTHDRDLAPTAPQSTRNVFGAAVPASGLSQPVSPACLATIRSSSRTFLGRRQYNLFTRAIQDSTARWKVIINEMPIQQFYLDPYDRWEGYEYERHRLLDFLKNNVKNAIFLTTDVHATLVNDARLQTLEPGGPIDSGIYDFTVGPAATKNYALEINETAKNPNAATLADAGFFTPAPPQGVGMRCSVLDKFGYGEVRVTSSTLSIASKGIDGKPLSECPRLTLTRR